MMIAISEDAENKMLSCNANKRIYKTFSSVEIFRFDLFPRIHLKPQSQ